MIQVPMDHCSNGKTVTIVSQNPQLAANLPVGLGSGTPR